MFALHFPFSAVLPVLATCGIASGLPIEYPPPPSGHLPRSRLFPRAKRDISNKDYDKLLHNLNVMSDEDLRRFIAKKASKIDDEQTKENNKGVFDLLRTFKKNYNGLGDTYSGFYSGYEAKSKVMRNMIENVADEHIYEVVAKRAQELAKRSSGPPLTYPPMVTDVAFAVSSRNISELIVLAVMSILLLVYALAYWLFFKWRSENQSSQKRPKLEDIILKGENVVLVEERKGRRASRRRTKKRKRNIK